MHSNYMKEIKKNNIIHTPNKRVALAPRVVIQIMEDIIFTSELNLPEKILVDTIFTLYINGFEILHR